MHVIFQIIADFKKRYNLSENDPINIEVFDARKMIILRHGERGEIYDSNFQLVPNSQGDKIAAFDNDDFIHITKDGVEYAYEYSNGNLESII